MPRYGAAAITSCCRRTAACCRRRCSISPLTYSFPPFPACTPGDCDHDGHCKSGYRCFQREGRGSATVPHGYFGIPGCKGLGTKNMDYCWKPPANHVNLLNFGGTPARYNLGKCEG